MGLYTLDWQLPQLLFDCCFRQFSQFSVLFPKVRCYGQAYLSDSCIPRQAFSLCISYFFSLLQWTECPEQNKLKVGSFLLMVSVHYGGGVPTGPGGGVAAEAWNFQVTSHKIKMQRLWTSGSWSPASVALGHLQALYPTSPMVPPDGNQVFINTWARGGGHWIFFLSLILRVLSKFSLQSNALQALSPHED